MAEFETKVETDNWEEFTKIAGLYFTDSERYEISREFNEEDPAYKMQFEEKQRDSSITVRYNGNPQKMIEESYFNIHNFFDDSKEF